MWVLKNSWPQTQLKKTKLIINTLRDPHSRIMFRDWLYHYWLMLYVNNLHYNCVNRESYPYNWDVVDQVRHTVSQILLLKLVFYLSGYISIQFKSILRRIVFTAIIFGTRTTKLQTICQQKTEVILCRCKDTNKVLIVCTVLNIV